MRRGRAANRSGPPSKSRLPACFKMEGRVFEKETEISEHSVFRAGYRHGSNLEPAGDDAITAGAAKRLLPSHEAAARCGTVGSSARSHPPPKFRPWFRRACGVACRNRSRSSTAASERWRRNGSRPRVLLQSDKMKWSCRRKLRSSPPVSGKLVAGRIMIFGCASRHSKTLDITGMDKLPLLIRSLRSGWRTRIAARRASDDAFEMRLQVFREGDCVLQSLMLPEGTGWHRASCCMFRIVKNEKTALKRASIAGTCLARSSATPAVSDTLRAFGDSMVALPETQLLDSSWRNRVLRGALSKGRVIVLSFSYTNCGSICPLGNDVMAAADVALEAVPGHRPVRLLIVTTDRQEDTGKTGSG